MSFMTFNDFPVAFGRVPTTEMTTTITLIACSRCDQKETNKQVEMQWNFVIFAFVVAFILKLILFYFVVIELFFFYK